MFDILVNSPYYWSLTGRNNGLRRQYVHTLGRGEGISLDKKEQLLAEAGFTVAQEKLWNLPSDKSIE
ncbi:MULTISPECIES: hypothetical protein [Spirosoma]|uniref:Uncharacterized protein n=1 Tax=Spirosoma sordidisoli TaxID=2502893 RepID=A0A4Q2UPU8_9BACT|nr:MULTISPECIES: hypothetical protein [Spirosoma]RYC69811.1 hypothetical protein EQG79_14555 [Spirosoma sordidisoli]